MQIIIQTQYRENYGAHNWDGTGECPQYWKNKGGDFYVVEEVRFEDHAKYAEFVGAAVKRFGCSYSNNYSEEYVLDWSVHEDGESIWEEWETPKRVSINLI